jgi:hypothetical protein
MIYQAHNNIEELNIKNSKDFIDYICSRYRISQTQLVYIYNSTYNTAISQPSFNRAVNNNNLRLDIVLNILKMLDCSLLIQHNRRFII